MLENIQDPSLVDPPIDDGPDVEETPEDEFEGLPEKKIVDDDEVTKEDSL